VLILPFVQLINEVMYTASFVSIRFVLRQHFVQRSLDDW